MVTLRSRCGHYIFALWFLSSIFFFSYSSPNLSGRKLDVYRTSTHGVALVRISNVGLKCGACGSLEIQDAKMMQKIAIYRTIFSGYIFDNRKKLVKQQYLHHMSLQCGELRPTSG